MEIEGFATTIAVVAIKNVPIAVNGGVPLAFRSTQRRKII
jgi:hypothetical protein